jgi:DNA-binding transcriptional regulator GbsR (MarR family)
MLDAAARLGSIGMPGRHCMTDFSDAVIALLRSAPQGLTSKDIAARLGTTAGNISSRLSKLAAYGVIGRSRGALVGPGSRRQRYLAPRDGAG